MSRLAAACSLILLLAACGDEPASPAQPAPSDASPADASPADAPPSDAAPANKGPAADPAAAGEQPEADGWPAVDDDPSLDMPPGSGNWCGTGRIGEWRPRESGARFGADGSILVKIDGRLQWLRDRWTEPDQDGVQRRVRREPLTDAERLHLRDLRDALEELIRATKDVAFARAATRERDRIQAQLTSRRRTPWVQFGIDRDGTFHVSEEGEGLDSFLDRVAEARAKAKAEVKAEAKK